MSETLYRKYRPQTFAEVVGQEHVKATLLQEIATGRLAQAYLFCGMRGVGKTTLARLLAKAVNCERRRSGTSEPCGACPSCLAIAQGRSLDLIEVDAASNRRIDDIRELRDHIPSGTAGGRYKVVIIDEVHMLTPEAFNALLKILEEPPAHVLFVLATTEVHKLPDTIISRCQRFDFKRLSLAELVQRLEYVSQAEGVRVDKDVLREVAYLSGGSTRDAESSLGKLMGLGEKDITMRQAKLVLPHSDLASAMAFVEHVVEHRASPAVELLNEFLEQGGEISVFFRQVTELLRVMLYVKLSGKLAESAGLGLDDPTLARLRELAPALSYLRLQRMLTEWLAADTSWREAEVWQLPLELAALSLAQPMEAPAQAGNPLPGASQPLPHPGTRPARPGSQPSLALEAIAERWAEVVAKLKEVNHSLSFIMSVARPSALDGNTLTVEFQYQLHQERLRDAKVRSAVEQALGAVLGTALAVRGVVAAPSVAVGGDLLSNVLTTMGGRVVD